MNTRKSSAGLALLLSFLVALPPAAFGDDTELFTTSANPNVLLMLDTTGSMSSSASGTSVGDLDGDGDDNTRMDILWKVVYTLLNADLSTPNSTVSATGTLGGARTTSGTWDTSGRCINGGSTTYNRIRLANFSSSEFNALPDSGTVVLGSGSGQDTVAYTSKGYSSSGGYYYLNFNSRTFASDWSVGNQVAYSFSGSYSNNFPTDHTEAISTDFLNNLTVADDNILKARLGLMTFTTNSSGSSVQINIRNQVASAAPNAPPFSPTYQNIWSSVTSYANASGGTPTAQALREAQTFFNTAYNNSTVCRPNFAVMITDGEDTMGGLDGATGNGFGPDYYNGGVFNADGWSSGSNTGQVNRNNAVIQEAADLLTNNPTVKLFTVGVGISDTTPDKNVLREVLRRAAEQQNATANLTQYNAIGAAGDSASRGAGRAFFATDATELSTALRNVFHQIASGTFSFTAPTVASVRMTDRNYLYKALFVPAAPPATLWEGHLQAFTTDNLNNYIWDADNVLKSVSPSDRRIYAGYTADNTTWSRREFTTSDSTGITAAMLGVDNTQVRDSVVDYVRGVGHDNNAKLGDIFHSKPVVVGPPSRFFFDEGYSTPAGSGFADVKATRRRVIYVGTNDGMLHAFLSGTYNPVTQLYDGGTGQELFGFVPYSLLNSMRDFLPGSLTTHEYFVDSSPRIADVWIPSGDTDITKDPSEWRTVLISGLRKGGDGYFALDITDPPTGDITSLSAYTNYPRVLWEYTDAAHLGETWSEPFIGKVRMRESTTSAVKDRWVAIFGGGKSDGTTATSLTVLDIATGTALKIFTAGTIDNGIVASPTAVLDAGGYIKMIYVNDIDGSLYKFNFIQAGVRSDGFSAWTVNKIFQPGAGQPVFHRVEAGSVDENTRYLFFGTGNQEFPVSDGGAGKFYAVRDTDTDNTLRTEANLDNVTSNLGSGTVVPSQYGWVVNLAGIPSGANSTDVANNHSGEKVLSDPVVFFNNVFFTTFTPDPSNPCSGGGIARVYGLQTQNARPGLFALPPESGTKVPYHIYTGSEGGIPSSPSLSIYPSGQSSIFVGFSTGSIREITIDSPLNMKTIKSWKETF